MKISSILVCLVAAILTAGCAPVIYRVNPDSPPKMGEKEARDAVELSLSLIKQSSGFFLINKTALEGDYIHITFEHPPYRAKQPSRYVNYSEVSPEIIKQGDSFSVSVIEPLYWKSEEDARLFLDGVYALRQWKIAREKGIKLVISEPAPPLKKAVVPSQIAEKEEPKKIPFPHVAVKEEPKKVELKKEEPKKVEPVVVAIAPPKVVPKPAKPVKSKEIPQKVISTVPELAEAKPAPSTSSPQAAPEPPKSAVSENIPPKITITAPDISRTVSVGAKRTDITIIGLAESNAGVIDVLVNGQQAELGEHGQFSSVVPLKVGQNKITVTAIDVFKNKATKQFAVNRETGKTAVMKAETMPPKITITAPDTTRAVSVVAKRTNITVTGVAESNVGIADVVVNGQQAELDEQGRFSTVIPLKVGQNTITVSAIDVLENKSTKQFAVNREAGIITAAIREESPVDTGFVSAKYYALLIAVQDYDSGEISKLDFAVSDARGLGDILVARYTFDKENVITLTNPDRRTIYKTLQSLRSKLTDRDNLLIFYAGHGYWQEDMKQGFWLPRDASGINDPSDWIPNSTVRDYIKAIKARHILLIADSCFSGGIFKTREAFNKQKISAEKIYELPSRKAITSGSMKTVPDRSVFLEYLVKRLKDNRETYLDTQKLFASLRDAVINNSPTHQTPLYGAISEAGDEGGDFVFVRRQ